MAEADISYADYLAGVARQRERDRDRYYGHDSHPDESAFDASNGKRIGTRATLHIEIDEEGEPYLVEYRARGDEVDTLRRAASHVSTWAAYMYPRHPDARAWLREREDQRKAQLLEIEQKRAAYVMDNPFLCDVCSGRFRTDRGKKQHMTRAHKPPPDDFSRMIVEDPADG